MISIGSIAGASGGGSYGSAKAARHNWTADLAFDLGGRGITVNAIAPGLIEDAEFFGGALPPERRATLIGQAADGRPGRPADIAAAVSLLASPEAGHKTDQVIRVNGGALLGH
ncbi:SDR family oxidoreductase [Actinoallomurus sp. NBC_01490]|uniref:SDR family oxidoreductase n=1 Tax=Actinoallomurus sp. NBC_01490 TaxID=2903557 RepID=UPI002E2F9ED2|nr:SDR family oxidoreductase [Actinoallomurus sp. NBC_01490]